MGEWVSRPLVTKIYVVFFQDTQIWSFWNSLGFFLFLTLGKIHMSRMRTLLTRVPVIDRGALVCLPSQYLPIPSLPSSKAFVASLRNTVISAFLKKEQKRFSASDISEMLSFRHCKPIERNPGSIDCPISTYNILWDQYKSYCVTRFKKTWLRHQVWCL